MNTQKNDDRINSQCYRLAPKSSQTARGQLKRIYEDAKSNPYKPVFVVIQGVIDSETPRSGFAADYDGMIDIISVRGACPALSAVVETKFT